VEANVEVGAYIKSQGPFWPATQLVLYLVVPLISLAIASCSGSDGFTQDATTQYFTQGYDPQYLDVLWMVDNRSPMLIIKQHLISEAGTFFENLANLAQSNYRMAFIDADMQVAPDQLLPIGSPTILINNFGTLSEREQTFASVYAQQFVNLHVGALDEGFASALANLSNNFVPRAGVPLILVFISDSDDHSVPPSTTTLTPIEYYATQYQTMTGNDPNMLHVYSVNLTVGGQRCTSSSNNDIDNPGFQNRYFLLAQQLNGATADLCGDFASQIDLSGIQLTQLPTSFLLNGTPQSDSISVSVYDTTQTYSNLSWTYNSSTNSIVFATAPPEGVTIQVTYNTQ
jgi:hypothetical protein